MNNLNIYQNSFDIVLLTNSPKYFLSKKNENLFVPDYKRRDSFSCSLVNLAPIKSKLFRRDDSSLNDNIYRTNTHKVSMRRLSYHRFKVRTTSDSHYKSISQISPIVRQSFLDLHKKAIEKSQSHTRLISSLKANSGSNMKASRTRKGCSRYKSYGRSSLKNRKIEAI